MKLAIIPTNTAVFLAVCLMASEGCNSTPPGGLADMQKRVGDAKFVLEQNGAKLTEKTFAMNQMCWSVDLSGKEIKAEALDALTRLNGLGELILKGSKIVDDQMAQIGQLSPLYVLDVSDTAVTDSGIAQLKQNTLARLDVSGSKVTSSGVGAIEKRFATDPAIHPFFRKIQVKK